VSNCAEALPLREVRAKVARTRYFIIIFFLRSSHDAVFRKVNVIEGQQIED
jgi:hypothetical protein